MLRACTRVATLSTRPAYLSMGWRRTYSVSRLYTKDHEWIEMHDKTATVGITDYAQKALGDVVFVEVPIEGTTVAFKEEIGAVESVKAASDVYAPCSGLIKHVNKHLESKPSLINKDPYGEGWFCKIEMSDPHELDGLMDASTYEEFTKE